MKNKYKGSNKEHLKFSENATSKPQKITLYVNMYEYNLRRKNCQNG
jgi:hypothetical protein